MSNHIYTVGHQSLNNSQSEFMNYVIHKEGLCRTIAYNASEINRQYDPVLQVEPHTETIKRLKDFESSSGNQNKVAMSAKYHEALQHLHSKCHFLL